MLLDAIGDTFVSIWTGMRAYYVKIIDFRLGIWYYTDVDNAFALFRRYNFSTYAIWGETIINDNKNKDSIEKEEKNMAVSMAVIPTLKGKAASSVLETLSKSKIKPYSQEAKVDTEKMLGEILQKRDKK